LTLDELGSLGEFLAAIATLATLVYLALQIRQNTRATRAASHHAITESLNESNRLVTGDPDVARIWIAGKSDRGAMSEVDRERFDFLLLAYFHVFDTLHYQARIGAGDQELLIAEEKSFAHLFSLPGVQDWWEANPYAFNPEFRSYMEGFRSSEPADHG
jgi:hypothetical protein